MCACRWGCSCRQGQWAILEGAGISTRRGCGITDRRQALFLAESVSKPGRSDGSAAPGAKLAGGTWEVGTRRTEAQGQQAQREPGSGTELRTPREGSPWAACGDQLHGEHVCGTFGASDGAGASCREQLGPTQGWVQERTDTSGCRLNTKLGAVGGA